MRAPTCRTNTTARDRQCRTESTRISERPIDLQRVVIPRRAQAHGSTRKTYGVHVPPFGSTAPRSAVKMSGSVPASLAARRRVSDRDTSRGGRNHCLLAKAIKHLPIPRRDRPHSARDRKSTNISARCTILGSRSSGSSTQLEQRLFSVAHTSVSRILLTQLTVENLAFRVSTTRRFLLEHSDDCDSTHHDVMTGLGCKLHRR